jgi:hypothetical protein
MIVLIPKLNASFSVPEPPQYSAIRQEGKQKIVVKVVQPIAELLWTGIVNNGEASMFHIVRLPITPEACVGVLRNVSLQHVQRKQGWTVLPRNLTIQKEFRER